MPSNNSNDLRNNVEDFLSDFKSLLDEVPIIISSHLKNERTKRRLGLTTTTIVDILYSLTPENYSKGPTFDELHPGIFWEFGIIIEGDLIYIKIKISTDNNGTERPVCYSFHDAEFEMDFPLS